MNPDLKMWNSYSFMVQMLLRNPEYVAERQRTIEEHAAHIVNSRGSFHLLSQVIMLLESMSERSIGDMDLLIVRTKGGIIVVNEPIFESIFKHYTYVIDRITADTGLRIFGSGCPCDSTCPATRTYRGRIICDKLLEKLILLKNIVNCYDITSVIYSKMIQ